MIVKAGNGDEPKMGGIEGAKKSNARETLELAHKHASKHREEILSSNSAGCFYCKSIFKPSLIEKWIDFDEGGEGQTAICPICGVSAVIGDKAGYPIDDKFLTFMKLYWF